MTLVRRLAALLTVWPMLSGCPEDAKRPLGATCADDSQCAAGLCIAQLCLDPDGDEDRDGLTNQLEGALGSSPVSADSDGDGRDDAEEVGVDLANPADRDGDGKIDAIESSVADADGDCVVDEADPDDGRPETDPVALARHLCLGAGACAAPDAVITASCDGAGAPLCDYQGVPSYEPLEVSCDGVDNDCDGATDEHHGPGGEYTYDGGPYPADAGKALGASCGAGACGGGTVICAPDRAALTCSTIGRAGPLTCAADADCDGVPDEEEVANPILTPLAGCKDYYADADGDGYGAGAPRCLCSPFGDYKVGNRTDCAEADPDRHPMAPGVCGVDADCDGSPLDADEVCDDADLDGTDGCHACQAVARRVSGDGPSPGAVVVAGLTTGGFVVGWDEGALADGARLGRSLRFYSAAGREVARIDGLGLGAPEPNARMQAAALPDGRVAIGSWRYEADRQRWAYDVTRYDATGTAADGAITMHTAAAVAAGSLSAVGDGRVAFVVPVLERAAARVAVSYLGTGGTVTTGAGLSTSTGTLGEVEALGLADGTLVLLWSEYDPSTFVQARYTQRLDAGGTPIGEPRPFTLPDHELQRAHPLRWVDDVARHVVGRLTFSGDTPTGGPSFLDEDDLEGCPYDFAAGFDGTGNAWAALADDECQSPARAWYRVDAVRELTLLDAALHPGALTWDLAADSSGIGFVAAFAVGGDAPRPGIYLVRIGGDGALVYVPAGD